MYANFQLLMAVIVILGTIYFLARRFETRMVLIAAGLILCVVALKPLMALDGFVKSMVTSGLIQNICSALGFAAIMKLTKCDEHLVRLLLKPVKNIGFFLIPLATLLTYCLNIAIPSAAGCAAAVGATMIPLLMASGVKPEMAAAAVFAGTFGSNLSPGQSHTAIVAEMANTTVMDLIHQVLHFGIGTGVLAVVGIAVMAIIYRDYSKKAAVANGAPLNAATPEVKVDVQPQERINIAYAMAPLLPLILLIVSYVLKNNTNLAEVYKDSPTIMSLLKLGVAQAMIIGALYGMLVTWSNPAEVTKKFFNGMGEGYANVMGIIIAASVFAAGLNASGAIDWFIELLKSSQNVAKWGSTLGPFFMGMISGSGDAATMAFNTSITPHAQSIGYKTELLGMAAAFAGQIGRTASPIAGAAIVCAGLANVNPIELAKRTAPVMGITVVVLTLWML